MWGSRPGRWWRAGPAAVRRGRRARYLRDPLMGAAVLSGRGLAGWGGMLSQVADERGDAAAQGRVGDVAARCELGVDLGYGQLGAGQVGADGREDLAQVRQGPGAAAGAGAGAHRGGRLAFQ